MRGLSVFQCRNLRVLQLLWRGADLWGPQLAGRGLLTLSVPGTGSGPRALSTSCHRSVHASRVKREMVLTFLLVPLYRVLAGSPSLGLDVLGQVSLCSGPFRLLKRSPICSRTWELMSHLTLSRLLQAPPGAGECGLLFNLPGRWWGQGHLPWFRSLPCVLVASATLMAPLLRLFAYVTSPWPALCLPVAFLFCARHVWGELVFGAGAAASW